MLSSVILYERDYRYGPDTSIGRGPSGHPPLLGNGVRVCEDTGRTYIEVATRTVRLMHEALGDRLPQLGFMMRSPSCGSQQAEINLILAAYFMQEFMEDGREHPLYKAATMPTLVEFQNALDAYETNPLLASLSLEEETGGQMEL